MHKGSPGRLRCAAHPVSSAVIWAAVVVGLSLRASRRQATGSPLLEAYCNCVEGGKLVGAFSKASPRQPAAIRPLVSPAAPRPPPPHLGQGRLAGLAARRRALGAGSIDLGLRAQQGRERGHGAHARGRQGRELGACGAQAGQSHEQQAELHLGTSGRERDAWTASYADEGGLFEARDAGSTARQPGGGRQGRRVAGLRGM